MTIGHETLIAGMVLEFDYTNYREEKRHRRVVYVSTEFGSNDMFHPTPGLRLKCLDLQNDNAERSFSVSDIDIATFQIVGR